MRRLMLLRHAKTETDSPSGTDRDRRLNERGQKDATVIGEWIGAHPPFPDIVLLSPALRARETWDNAWTRLKAHCDMPQVEIRPELYGADPASLLHTIRSVTNPGRLMLISHNPGMHEVALMLMDGTSSDFSRELTNNLPTSGLAIFDFDVADWGDIGYRRGKLVTFISPRLLREYFRPTAEL